MLKPCSSLRSKNPLGLPMGSVNVIDESVLVLNRNWQPVNVASVARAFTMVCKEAAAFVDVDTYEVLDWDRWAKRRPKPEEVREGRYVRSAHDRFCVPEVVKLLEYDRLPESHVTFSRRNLYKRDHYTCQYCKMQPGSDELSIDHVVPRAQGGESSWTNCVLSCIPCNAKKADRTPEQAGMRLANVPMKPEWEPSYAGRVGRNHSWAKFISEAYWDSELEN